MVLVQGVAGDGGIWGENLANAKLHPVKLANKRKLAYRCRRARSSALRGSELPARATQPAHVWPVAFQELARILEAIVVRGG